MTPIPDPDLTASGGSTDHAGYVPVEFPICWTQHLAAGAPAAMTDAARELLASLPDVEFTISGRFDTPVRIEPGMLLDVGGQIVEVVSVDPEFPVTPLAADPFDQGRCLVGCGHTDTDPRCTGVWRMSDFGEVPF